MVSRGLPLEWVTLFVSQVLAVGASAVGRQGSTAELGHVVCVSGIVWRSFGRWSPGVCRWSGSRCLCRRYWLSELRPLVSRGLPLEWVTLFVSQVLAVGASSVGRQGSAAEVGHADCPRAVRRHPVYSRATSGVDRATRLPVESPGEDRHYIAI